MSILNYQHPVHAHLLMITKIKKQNLPMKRCVTKSKMQDFLYKLDGKSFTYYGEEVYLNVFLDADWNSHYYKLNTSLSNTKNKITSVCFHCGENKEWLCEGYLLDIF